MVCAPMKVGGCYGTGWGSAQRLCKYEMDGGDIVDNNTWKVYVHVNKDNGKKYVGITSKQKVEHRWNSGRGYKENSHFYAAIQKYGWDGFKHTVLFDGLSEQQAKAMECHLIETWHTQDNAYGYNMTSGGDGTPGYHPSVETRQKLSDAHRRENLSEDTIRRRSEGLKGRKLSNEHKRKIGDGNSKAIDMLDKNGVVLRHFKSAHEAECVTNISHSHISQCCHGSRNSSGGYCWRFAQSF